MPSAALAMRHGFPDRRRRPPRFSAVSPRRLSRICASRDSPGTARNRSNSVVEIRGTLAQRLAIVGQSFAFDCQRDHNRSMPCPSRNAPVSGPRSALFSFPAQPVAWPGWPAAG
jgi:hypothetical protein